MIAVLTDPGVGGTFLTWTLYYLSGQNNYYLSNLNKRINLVDNPLTKSNAHSFCPNQANSIEEFNSKFNDLSKDHNNFNVLYFHNFPDCDRTSSGTTAHAVNHVAKNCKKIIQLSIEKKNSLYHCTYNKRHIAANNQHQHQLHQEFIQKYFNDSNQKWKNLNLTNIWDYREFLALNLRPTNRAKITDIHNFDFDHYCLDAMDLWTRFDQSVTKLFEYLNLPIDTTRWNQWINVYTEWRKIHYQAIQFDLYFDKILDYIITGKNLNLQSFDLDILQESVIQHTLIYKHNVNLKTWQLEKFQSTKQLHTLLEPNTHPINKI
jgi:hypothetical protein